MSQNGKYVMQGIRSLKMTRNLSAAIRKFILRKIMSRNKKLLYNLRRSADIR